MNKINSIARSLSLSQKSKKTHVNDLVLSRRKYSNPIQIVEALRTVTEKVKDTTDSSIIVNLNKGNSIYSEDLTASSDEIKYSDSNTVKSVKSVKSIQTNDIISSYLPHSVVCCDNIEDGLKMMFLECGHFVHTKCISDDLLSAKNPICKKCDYQITDDEIKCILIKSTGEYSTEKDRLEKQHQFINHTLAEYNLALRICVDSLNSITKTYNDLSDLYSRK